MPHPYSSPSPQASGVIRLSIATLCAPDGRSPELPKAAHRPDVLPVGEMGIRMYATDVPRFGLAN